MKLHDGAVDVWRVELDRVEPAMLSADERARAARFARDLDRDRFVAARTALRRVLGAYLDCAAERVAFRYGARGKPSLDLDPAPLAFNLSHSHGLALIAIARAPAVGVDVEHHRAIDADALAASGFSPAERRALAAFAPRDRLAAFFRGWTRKEATIKAHGDGLYLPLDRFTVSLDDTDDVSIDPPGVAIRSLATGDDSSAALAIAGAAPTISWFTYES
jgi:4'-phosphopantetheinyl transferase